MIFAGAARWLALGLAIGFALTLAAERLIRSVLFGVSPLDGATLGGAALVLALVCAIAALLPARRAAGIDPLEAMRIE
jgi:macrolide transport system ATP-binding/permease protein